MACARAIAIALAGRRAQRCSDGSWLTRCPVPTHGRGRGDRSPSLAVRDGRDQLLVKCFSGCAAPAVLAELRRRGLLGGAPAPTRRAPVVGDRAGRSDPRRRIWEEAASPLGTLVEAHLARRGLSLPPFAGDVIRFHRACPFGRDDGGHTVRTPAMVALVRNIITNAPQAIHRTALDSAGHKIKVAGRDRMALGPLAGGAVKLTPDEDVTLAIGIAEGIETALSLQRLPEWRDSPVWSVLNAAGMRAFPLLAGIETLVIGVDHDAAGEAAARVVTARWHGAGRVVLLIEATATGDDLNDVLQR